MESVSVLLLLLIPPLSALLAVAARSLANLAWWPAGSSSSMRKLGKTVAPEQAARDEVMSVSRYTKGGDSSPAAVECVVCLSGIEEGDEVRELRCRHLFHRRCLDQWLARPPATCPLCRCRLLNSPEEEDDDDGEEEEDSDMVLLMACVQSSCTWLSVQLN